MNEHGWQHDPSFSESLYEWMQRAPWLGISAAAHLLLFFVLAAIPWNAIFRQEPPVIVTALDQVPEDVFEEPPEVPPEDPIELPVEVDPKLQEVDTTPSDEMDFADSDSDANLESDSYDETPFNSDWSENLIGLGGGAGRGDGGHFGDRGDGRKPGRPKALNEALQWLVAHQSPEGFWDADGYTDQCGAIGSTVCEGTGSPLHDVGVTGLALLALLGDGHTTISGEYRETVARGVMWLREQQDPDTGLVGDRASHEFLYNHAIASLALCEAYYFAKSPLLERPAELAVEYVQRARNPYGAWRYEVPPNGESDTSVTGWMVLVLTSAGEAGLTVDPAALEGAHAWLDEVTDPSTGRVGYAEPGSLSSRTPENEHFPRDSAEAMTAVGLLSRAFLGLGEREEDKLERHAQLLRRTLPEWDPEGLGCDMYAWYYGTYAMFQMGGDHWRAWKKAMERAVVDSQRQDGDARGSWDPVGPWGSSGGRVYSTALMALCLEVTYRYGRVVGARWGDHRVVCPCAR